MARFPSAPDGNAGVTGREAPALQEGTVLTAVLAAEALLLVGAAVLFGFGIAVSLFTATLFLLVAYRAPDLAWSLVFLAMPFSSERSIAPGLAVIVPTEPMMLLALLALLVRMGVEGSLRIPPSPMHLPLGVTALIAFISAVVGVAPLAGIKYWVVSAAYAAFGYLPFLVSDCSPARRRRWERLVVAVGAFWGVYGTVRMLYVGVTFQHGYGIARPFFPEHGTYAAFLSLLLPLAVLLALERRGWERVLHTLATLAIATGITLSFTRAAWLAVVVVVPLTCGAWALWRRRTRRLLLPAVIAAAIVALILGLGAGGKLARHAESIATVENVSNLERLNRWSAAVSMAESRPWLGVGFGGYEAAYRTYRGRHFTTEESSTRMGPHSEPLRLLSELGVPGFLAAMWFLVAAAALGLRVFRRARDEDDRMLALAMMSGIGTYVIHGVFNAYLGIDKVSLPFWLAFGAIATLGRRISTTRGPAARSASGDSKGDARHRAPMRRSGAPGDRP